MSVSIVQVDAFTSTPFAGNPAAVCLLHGPVHDRWMQDLAREMNLSETAFLVRHADGFDLRWFTPAVEVDLCGHATLASAHFLWEDAHLKGSEVARFHTKSGLLTAVRKGEWIEMDFPSTPASAAEVPEEVLRALGPAQVRYTGKSRFDYLIEVDSEAAVREMRPDFGLLKSAHVRGVLVTSRSESPDFDFVSRFFAPGAGIDEDPVTGSAHTSLAPYWGARLGKTRMTGFQASARGGIVRVTLAGERVLLGGQAVTVMRAELMMDAPYTGDAAAR